MNNNINNNMYTINKEISSANKNIQKIFTKVKTKKTYSKNQVIYRQGDYANFFYYIKSGQAKVFLTSPNGEEKTLKLLNEGNILGDAAFFDKDPRVSSAKAVKESEIISINNNTLLDLFSENPNLAMDMLALQAKTIRLLSTQIDNMAFMEADSRIAQLLLQSFTTINNKNIVSLTHEEIGSMVGVSRVTVSKTLKEFNNLNYTETKYRSIIIKNINGLIEIANT